MNLNDIPITTHELRAAYNRAPALRFLGLSFERACAAPLILWSLKRSALAVRRSLTFPIQSRLL